MKKKLLSFVALSVFALSLGANANEYTELDLNLYYTQGYSLQIKPGPHTRVDVNENMDIDVSNHNYDHRATSYLSVLNAQGRPICRYEVSLISGKEASTTGFNHNGLRVLFNDKNQCLAAGDNGQYTPGNASTRTNTQGQSHIDLKVFPIVN